MKTRKRVFVKCRNGHWFFGKACPIDGYYDELTDSVMAAEERILSSGDDLTLKTVAREAQLSEGAASTRFLVIETAGAAAADELFCLVERTS